MITPTIRAALDTFQQAANRGTAVYLSLELVQELRDALKAEPDAEALAARPLLEQVAAMADCIGAQTVGQITAISNRAAAWLRDNPPGQQVAIKPRGCPTPGACSCVEPAPPAPEPGELGELVELLKLAGRWATSTGVHLDRFAALFDQQATELAALRRVPVALSEWEDAFMSGVCAALATVTAHGDSVIWREIVRSVGIDNALNYAANVNPEDWDLAGFSKYAQPELGKDKPLPAPEPGELVAWLKEEAEAYRNTCGTNLASQNLDNAATLIQQQQAELAALRGVSKPEDAAPLSDEHCEAVHQAVAEALGNAYDCMRVWSAWGCGTMGSDDFTLTAEDDDRVAEIADAAIEAFRTFQVPAPQAGEGEA